MPLRIEQVFSYPRRSRNSSNDRKQIYHRAIGAELAGRVGAVLVEAIGDAEGPDIMLNTQLGRRTVEHTKYIARDEFHDVELLLGDVLEHAAESLEQLHIFEFSVNFTWQAEPRHKPHMPTSSPTRKTVPNRQLFSDELVRVLRSLDDGPIFEWYQVRSVAGREPWPSVAQGDRLLVSLDPVDYPELTRCCQYFSVHRHEVGGAWLVSESARMVGFDSGAFKQTIENKMKSSRNSADWLLVESGFYPRSSQMPRRDLSKAVKIAREVHRAYARPYRAIIFRYGQNFIQVDGSELLPNLRQHP